MTESSDADLLGAHVRGSPTAFGDLVRRHQDRLWSVALGIVGNPHDAADVVQEAMVKAFRRADTFRGDAAVSTWLHRIVVTTALDAVRSARRAPVPSQVLPDHPDPRDATAAPMARIDVHAALRQLPHDQRAAVVLIDMVGMSVAEASQALGVPAGTVKSRCFRARAALAPLLRQDDGSSPTVSGNRRGPRDVETTAAPSTATAPSEEGT